MGSALRGGPVVPRDNEGLLISPGDDDLLGERESEVKVAAGVDPTARLFHLATFLGHVSPSSTAVYLTITAELLGEANRRFEGFAAAALPEVAS